MSEESKLRELLVKPGHVSEKDFSVAVAESSAGQRPLADILIDRDIIKDDQLGALLADDLGIAFLNLSQEKIDPVVLRVIPESVARLRGVLAASKDESSVKLACLHPADPEFLSLLEKKFGQTIKPYLVTPRAFESALAAYGGQIGEEVNALVAKLSQSDVDHDEHNREVISLVDALLTYGHQSRSSDVHLEPSESGLLVRFRIDGVLHDVLPIPKLLVEPITTRLKIMSKLRIDEHFSAQDGKLRFSSLGRPVDVRVSMVPTTGGENVVLRILSEQSRRFSLSDLGLPAKDFEKIRRAIDNPHGLILVVGPTGSGKTTTVYAVIKILNQRDVHIATIEDPVEYMIDGISQIQVNTKTNLTFAAGLRSIVRQDPDIIVVGEIRDEETASIAVNSAMTGHLVLSTLHANDAPTTLPRLLEMGIEPFLVASTVNVVMAQRLVRRICERCRFSREINESEQTVIQADPYLQTLFTKLGYKKTNKLTVYQGRGCPVCGGKGFVGRIGIFEVLTMTELVREAIIRRAASSEILKIAGKEGMTTMLEDGLAKVIDGVTTLEEVLRMIKI